ncbi:MAG: hypothetical protein ABUL54_10055 [Dongia sp.]
MTRTIGTRQPGQTEEKRKRLRQRNWALLAALLGFVVLVYVITIVKMKGA